MAGLWSVKFDHTNGETRKCKLCDTEFHATKPRWRCNACVNKAQKLIEE
jgi:Zn finger protein HypA/HybF involved in hydrogenase expression